MPEWERKSLRLKKKEYTMLNLGLWIGFLFALFLEWVFSSITI